MQTSIRPAAVAGMFYPGEAAVLARDVSAMLAAAPLPALRPKAMIVPHAGYVYSGAVAARAYALLAPLRDTIRRVVLFGPTHRVATRGLAVPTVTAFDTPLGRVMLDAAAIDLALRLPQVQRNDACHAQEHSLEVQLPFLQTVLGNFALVPFAVGQSTPLEVAQVMMTMWGGPETLILVSSDLSHYQPYDAARDFDRASVDAILDLKPLTTFEQACGALPVNSLIELAKLKKLVPTLLDLRNSGDTAGDKARVVGYAAIAFSEPADTTSSVDDKLGAALLARARNAIAGEFGMPAQPEPSHPALAQPGATFVTLTQEGALRGCIGSLEAWRPLETDIRANARAAAFRDSRFEPLTRKELARTRVEVSLLTTAQPMSFKDENDALGQMRPQLDGIILEAGDGSGRRSTFLPQVWDQLPVPRQFLAQLKQKAGLPADWWSPQAKLLRYEVNKWKEAGDS